MVAKSTLMKWHYITGLILVVVVGIHLAFRWPSYEASIEWAGPHGVYEQLMNIGYMIAIFILLYAATYHAMNGLRTLLLELHQGKYWNIAVDVVIIIVGVFIVIVGTVALVGALLTV
ncbi:hypothetical protein [Caldivirga sp.]|uniref:hypothetical protein n=1 Tax=Caldivirga sp. TaxID=2080243 RepID=UPI0025C57116|nr:hypothetical protein [Caldivirga sp.]